MTFPGAGNDVGTAYIRILADGSGLDRSIRDEVKNGNARDKTMRDLGKNMREDVRKGFNDEGKNKPLIGPGSDIDKEMQHNEGAFRRIARDLGGKFGRDLRGAISVNIGGGSNNRKLTDLIFGQIERDALGGGGFASIERNLKNLVRLREQASASLIRQSALDKRQADAVDKEFARRLARLSTLLETHNKHDVDNTIAAFRTRADKAVDLIGKGKTSSDIGTLTRDLDRFADHAKRGLVKVQGYFSTSLRELTPLEIKMKKLNDDFDKASQLAGKAFGKGSRNNFFNALGAGVEGLTKVAISGIPRVLGFLGELKSEFSIAGKSGEGFAGKIGAVMDTVFNNVNQVGNLIIQGFAGAVGGIGLFITVAGPLAVAISALTAGAIGLAGALGFALAGALGTVAPLILPLIASVGVLGLAFSNMSKSAKKSLSADFKPIVKSFQNLRESIQDNLFKRVGQDVKLLGPTFARTKPIISGVANAISQVFDVFVRKLRGPGFVAFLATMRKFLPDAVLRLGDIFGNIFTGIAGVFRALAPFATKFLQTLQKLTDRFDNWANSTKGQNRITKFMQDAGRAAQAVWTVITSLVKVTGDLLSAGNKPGQGFLKSISDSLDRFSTFLRSPEGQKGLQTFFQRAKDAFGGLGVLLGGLGKLFGALNSQAGQTILVGLFKALGGVLKVFAQALPTVTALLQGMGQAARGLYGFLRPLFEFFGSHTGVLKAVGAALGIIYVNLKLMAVLRFAENGLSGLFTLLSRGAIGAGATATGVGLGQIANGLGSMSRAMRSVNAAAIGVAAGGIAGQVSGGGTGGWLTSILGGAAIGGGFGAAIGGPFAPITAAIGAIGGALAGTLSHANKLWSDHAKAAKDAATAAAAAADAEAAHVDSLAAAISAANGLLDINVRKQVVADLSKSGALKALDQLGFNLPTVTDAVLGNQKAIFDLTSQIEQLEQAGKLTVQQGDDLLRQIGLETKSVGDATAQWVLEGTALGDATLAKRNLRDEFKNFGNVIKGDSAAAQENIGWVRAHIKALQDNATTALINGTASDKVKAKYLDQINALKGLLQFYGFDTDAVQGLIDKYGKVPPVVATAIKLNGLDLAKGDAAKLLKLLPPTRTMLLQLATADATFDLHAFLNQIPHSVDIQAHLRGQNTALVSAAGRLTNGPTLSWIGEAGPEAVVPLRRPLSQVDASVRWLSAIAQGKALPNGTVNKMASGGIVGGGKTVNFGPGAIQVVTPTTDPRAVANELLNEMVAKGY